MNLFHTHFKIAVVGLKLVKAEVDRFNLHMQFDCFKIVHAKQLVTWRTIMGERVIIFYVFGQIKLCYQGGLKFTKGF